MLASFGEDASGLGRVVFFYAFACARRYRLTVNLALIAGLAALFSQVAMAQSTADALLDLVQECDILAAHPDDPERMAEGVPDDRIVPRLAIRACKEATKGDATDPRFAFQLGRALLTQGKKKESFEQFRKAAGANHAAGLAYLGDAYQFGHGVEADLQKALDAYKKAAERGFEKAQGQIEQMTFNKDLYTLDLLNLFFSQSFLDLNMKSDSIESATKWIVRSYVFSLTQKLMAECGRIISPQSVLSLYRYRYGGGWTAEMDAQVSVSIQPPIAESDAEVFLKRHGCEGPVARHTFSMIDRFLSSRKGD
jgi:TPR repeat protein